MFKTCEAYNLAYELKYQRYQRALELAKIIKLDFAKARHIKKMINKLYPSMPCSSWLNHMCGQNGITIKTPQTLEAARKKYCHINAIRAFFTKHEHLLKRDPHLLWNADETSAASSRKYKVLINTPNVSPITVMRPLEPHITGIFPYNAAGHQFDPFIILHDLINLPEELKNFNCFFTSQKSGWCTIKIFEIFSIYFANKISVYRQSLPKTIRNETIVLLVDNHSSRFSSFAVEYLRQNNIRLVTFPPHCTNVLQPFDVCVVRGLKSRITTSKLTDDLKRYVSTLPTRAAQARYSTIYAIVNAWKTTSTTVLQNSFKYTGIYEFNSEIAENNKYVNQASIIINYTRGSLNALSNEELTNDENRLILANKTYSKNFENLQQIPKFTEKQIVDFCYDNRNMAAGLALSDFPLLFNQIGPKTFQTNFRQS